MVHEKFMLIKYEYEQNLVDNNEIMLLIIWLGNLLEKEKLS